MKAKIKKYKAKLSILTKISTLHSLSINISFDNTFFKISPDCKKTELEEKKKIFKSCFYPLFTEDEVTYNINYIFVKETNVNISNLKDNTLKIELFSLNLSTIYILELKQIEKNGIFSYSKINKEEYIEISKSIAQCKLRQASNLVESFGKYIEAISNSKSICFYYMSQDNSVIRKYFEDQQKVFTKNEKSKIEYSLKKGVEVNFNFGENLISSDSKQFDLLFNLIKMGTEERLEEYINITNLFLNIPIKNVEDIKLSKLTDVTLSKSLSEYNKTIENGSIKRNNYYEKGTEKITKNNQLSKSISTSNLNNYLDNDFKLNSHNNRFEEKIRKELRGENKELKLNKSSNFNFDLNVDNFFEKNIKKSLRKGKQDTPKFKLNKESMLYNIKELNNIQIDTKEFSKKSIDTNESKISRLLEICDESKKIHQLHEIVDLNNIVENTSEIYSRLIFTQLFKFCFIDLLSFELSDIKIMKPASIYQFMIALISMKKILLTTENISALSGFLLDM